MTGAATFILSGIANTYTGSTTVNGATLEIATLAVGGTASSIGESSNAASNLVIAGGGTLDYTGATATTDRSFTLGTGGGTFVVATAGATLTVGGDIANGNNDFTLDGAGNATFGGTFIGPVSGSPGTMTKNDAGIDTFTSDLAFGSTNNLTTYGSITTGDVTVNEGQLVSGSIRLNAGGRQGNLRGLNIAAGAIFTCTGTVAIDPSDEIYVTQIVGPGTLQLRNPDASESNPSLMDDAGPLGGDGGPWGTIVTAVIDVGDTGTQVMDGKTNRNDVSRYSGDIRFDAPITGSASIQFYGLNDNSNRSMHFVLNADNSGTAGGSPAAFTGGVLIANCDLDLTNNNGLTAANSVTFDSIVDPNTLDLGSLYLWGFSVTIGSLNDMDAAGTLADIRNGSSMYGNGGGGPGGSVLPLEQASTLTITQTMAGNFGGVFCDGPNDAGNGTSEVAGNGYEPLNVNVTGTAPLTLTGATSGEITGSVSVDPSTLTNNGSFTTAGGFTVSAGSTLNGSGTDDGGVSVSGTIEAGANSTTGILTIDNLSFGTGGTLAVQLNGTTSGTGYDQLIVTSSVNLTGASLDVTLGAGFNPAVGTSFEIISNTGGGGVAGTFTNLPEGSVTMIGGLPFVVSYIGGDGDDVTLTRTSATLTSDPVGPIMPGTSVTFTATIANGNSANAGTVSFYYDYGLSNQVQIGNPVDLVNGSATSDATTTLPVGSDVVTAVYTDGTGASGILATLTIQVGSTPPPSIASVVINQNISSLYNAAGQPAPGTQRSMVNDIVYTFNEPVNIVGAGADPNVFTISVAPGWTGTVPTLSWAPVVATNDTEWAVTFSGNGVTGGSIANGAYDITVNHPNEITAVSDSQQLTLAANGIGGATQSFYRLFGDINGDEVVNAADNLKFKQALTTYNPAFDFNDDGIVNAADNLKFKNDLTVNFSGFTPTI